MQASHNHYYFAILELHQFVHHRNICFKSLQGTEDGFIDGAMEVYPVKKKDASGDYHDNVDAATFMKWFTKLLNSLDATNEKYLIVIGNSLSHLKINILIYCYDVLNPLLCT